MKQDNQSRTGYKFLTGQGVQEGAAPLCRNDFFLSLL